MKTKLYMAPMEGLTGYVFRSAYQKYFHNVDRYFTPFINNRKMNYKELNDILPEHNPGMEVVPQILTNRAEDFIAIAKELAQYGYETVNLNLGCPSGTVAAKHRGAGFLAVPDELDRFLEEIFAVCPLRISIKTRIGKNDWEDWEALLAIYEKYPLEELIIHPRIQKDFYRNTPKLEAFELAVEKSSHSLCYNGDIFSVEDYRGMVARFPQVDKVMIGRGIFMNPGLIGEIRGETPLDVAKLKAFHDEVLNGYLEVMSGERNTLFRMKEWWSYLGSYFTESEKYLKKIRKAQRLEDYEAVVAMLFREQ